MAAKSNREPSNAQLAAMITRRKSFGTCAAIAFLLLGQAFASQGAIVLAVAPLETSPIVDVRDVAN